MTALKETSPVSLTVMTASDKAECDEYVKRHPQGQFFHLSGWPSVVEAVYGYKNNSLIARRGDRIVGLMPLSDVSTTLLGRALISTAFSVGGGIISDSIEIAASLAETAETMGQERRVKYIELRNDLAPGPGWIDKTGVYSSFELPLPADENENLLLIPRKRRAEIRKAISAAKEGKLCVRVCKSIDEFYRLYSLSLRDHGTPVFPKRFLSGLYEAFSSQSEISIAEVGGKPVAGLLSFYFKNKVLPYYIGALPAAREVRAAEYLYWSLMRRATETEITLFDFGRSKIGTGPYQFKKLWGAEPQPLAYRYRLVTASELPNVNPNNPKFAAFVAMWRRLPLPVANRLGPLLAANFP